MSDNTEKRLVFLVGKNVILRPIEVGDLPTLMRWVNDPEVREFVGQTFPKYQKQEEEWLSKLGSETNLVFGIETKAGDLIGTMGTSDIKWKDRVCTTGAMIGEKEYWGKGLGTDAKMILLDYLFNTLNMHKVCSAVIAYNKRSLQYSLHCGYKLEGTRRKHTFKKGRYWDLLELGLFRKEWLPIWKKYQATGSVR